MSHCGNSHSRHWFTVYGNPGLRSPVCRRCGIPNPRPLTEIEQREYDVWLEYIQARRASQT
jgi:hypothetical protein